VLVMLAQAAVGLIETYFVGQLGTDALAGVTLVFPVLMLMQMMSGGAMGGGISSAIARALGAGRRDDADALTRHALAIGLGFGLGPFPRLGVAGGAVAVVAYYFLGSIALALYLTSARSVVHLSLRGLQFRWPLFRDILKVGLVAALVTVTTNLTIAITTGYV